MNNIKLKEEKNILFIKKGIISMRYYIYYIIFAHKIKNIINYYFKYYWSPLFAFVGKLMYIWLYWNKMA